MCTIIKLTNRYVEQGGKKETRQIKKWRRERGRKKMIARKKLNE